MTSPARPTRPSKQEQEPASDEITEVAPGVLRLQLPISLPGLGHVNCYALEDDRGVAVVDPGLPGPEPWRSLAGRLSDAGFAVGDVHTVVVTHSHPDHFGGADRLRQEADAEVVTHRLFRNWWDPGDDAGLDRDGVDGEEPAAPAHSVFDGATPWGGEPLRPPPGMRGGAMRSRMRSQYRAPEPSVRLEDAEVVRLAGREWVAVHTPGHTPDHLCLFDPAEGVLLSGDHVLPTITPHISGIGAGADPLTGFFESLARMHTLDGVRTVLPAHGHPFSDLGGRADAIRRHHDERLQTLRAASAGLGPATVTALSHELFSQRVWGPMAESETYAHLEHLRLAGQATRTETGGMLHYTVG